MQSVFNHAAAALAVTDPEGKCEAATALREAWRDGRVGPTPAEPPEPIGEPGRPDKPRLVPPRELSRRGLGTEAGRAALVHAVAHIEFNAINLALDAVYRFRGQPNAYYGDWLRVAAEEASHFCMLTGRLRRMGREYGDFSAHNGLWEMAKDTAHDVLIRMALVPRVLEARGLDVTPGMIERLRHHGDEETVRLLEVILREEVDHVAIGSRWFRHACAERGLSPETTFRELLATYMRGTLKGPFNIDARMRAGFSREELAALERC